MITTHDLRSLPLPKATLDSIAELARRRRVKGAMVYTDGGGVVRVAAWGADCATSNERDCARLVSASPTHVWTPAKQTKAAVRPGSKTAQATALVAKGATPHYAARVVGVSPSAVYRALQRGANRCSCCGRPIRSQS